MLYRWAPAELLAMRWSDLNWWLENALEALGEAR
jgi:hypothetical protein